MRKLRMFLLLSLCSVSSAFAQGGNTTAGLAGVGAGAALNSAAGQGGTTPSSAAGAAGAGAGGGSTPIEIQIMVFKGMQEIASSVAGLTEKHEPACKAALDADTNGKIIAVDRTKLQADVKRLEEDRKTLNFEKDSDSAGIPKDRTRLEDDLKGITEDKQTLDDHISALNDATKKSCAILVEDATSANQIGLYQAVQGYYGHLGGVYGLLQEYFALQLDKSSLNFTFLDGFTQTVNITNASSEDRIIKTIEIAPPNPKIFKLDSTTCMTTNPATKKLEPTVIKKGASCVIEVFLEASTTTPAKETNYLASLTISSGHIAASPDDKVRTDSVQTVKLTGTVPAAPVEAEKQGKKPAGKGAEAQPSTGIPPGKYSYIYGVPSETAAAPTPTPAATPAAGGAAASTPAGLTYLSDITTALGGLKSNITYGPSSFQPTTQAFEVLVEAELKMKGIFPYTSTSALDLTDAANKLTEEYSKMLVWGNYVTAWTNQCKPPANGPSANNQSGVAPNTACADPSVAINLAVAQQLITGYTTLLATASDGNGNPVIVDVLRGRVLSDKIAEGIPSLQVTIAAAGGSTKTNSIFGVNLFYTFAPSYNAGVIATFELRDNHNVLVESGARNVLFAYGKWKSKRFHPFEMRSAATCGSFCSED